MSDYSSTATIFCYKQVQKSEKMPTFAVSLEQYVGIPMFH